ncbi:hypothetical protein QYE76_052391 [Lolium multiflorum]|uniref:Reverse transcriptase/retrotransposon-derived protein RNase H-like domain-containing protein n=1 Tax=Lolium multiflorum TaxID=4521 RepID=A0AAD8SV20_LOLMU|nr:hypothetical protein QYE76_052391 [Lolium multiflorum]
MLVTAPILASPLEREPMLLYIAATNRVVSVVVVVEREEEGKTVQRPVYYLSEVLSSSKQNYPHFQKMTYGVFMAATKLKHYFEEHPMKVVSEAPISDIMGSFRGSAGIRSWRWHVLAFIFLLLAQIIFDIFRRGDEGAHVGIPAMWYARSRRSAKNRIHISGTFTHASMKASKSSSGYQEQAMRSAESAPARAAEHCHSRILLQAPFNRSLMREKVSGTASPGQRVLKS